MGVSGFSGPKVTFLSVKGLILYGTKHPSTRAFVTLWSFVFKIPKMVFSVLLGFALLLSTDRSSAT